MRIVQATPMVSAKNGKNNLHRFENYFMKIGGATEVEGLVKRLNKTAIQSGVIRFAA
jgi:hypothetical protein